MADHHSQEREREGHERDHEGEERGEIIDNERERERERERETEFKKKKLFLNICIYKLLLLEVYAHKCLIYLAFNTPGIGVFFMIGVPSTPNSNTLIVLFELY